MSNGYVRLEYGGKERGFKFNTIGVKEYLKEYPADSDDVKMANALAWGGLKGNSYAKKEEEDFTWEDITEWTDTLYVNNQLNDFLLKLMEAIQESQTYKLAIAKANAIKEEEKKSPKQRKKKG